MQQRYGACYDEAAVPGKHQTVWICSLQRLQFPLTHYPSTCWTVQWLTSSCLASFRGLTPFDRSSRMYSRCCSVKLGRRPGTTALGPRLGLARD